MGRRPGAAALAAAGIPSPAQERRSIPVRVRRAMLAGMASSDLVTDLPLERTAEVRKPGDGPSIVSCPYLTSANRSWVASGPSRDHRCGAVAPAAPLSTEKQRRLCLTADHETCATYIAALEARETRVAGQADGPLGWGWVRTTLVVDGSVGIGPSVAAMLSERRTWQVIPAIALVAALGALGLSNIGSGPARPSATPTHPGVVATSTSSSARPTMPTPTASSNPSASAAPTATPAPTAAVTQTPVPTAPPAVPTTYRVKSGDSLYAIAQQFGVSVSALKSINGLVSNTIHVGQVLKIP